MIRTNPAGSRFGGLWSDLAGIGRDGRRGGYSRHGFDDADLQLREWFTEQAHAAASTSRSTATGTSGLGGARRGRGLW